MGADKKSIIRKCGEILINIKSNKKSKVYVFNCAFCSKNCDQLKKFSLHLDENHSQELSDGPLPASLASVGPEAYKQDECLPEEDIKENVELFVPEIKVEELMEIEPPFEDELDKTKMLEITMGKDENEDPLETAAMKLRHTKARISFEADVKRERAENNSDAEEGDPEDNAYDFNCNEMDYEDSVDGSGSESDDSNDDKVVGKAKTIINKRSFKFNSATSEVSSDDSRDSDFNPEAKVIKLKKKTKKQFPNVDEKLLITTMLEAFEKHPVLWEVKDRSHDRTIRRSGFQAIAKEVTEKLQIQIKWEDIRKRIKTIRDEYSREFDKQLKGDKCEMPWYTEHMKFLEENIQVLIKHRYQKKKYRRLKTLDESHIPILIQYYKNCEILWQINNIAFVVKPKKIEALKVIIEDLKTKHNIDINIHDMQRRLDYINRIYSTDREQQLKCEAENKEFVPFSKYYEELSFLSESQGPFKCPHCNEIMYKFESYHQHVAEHTNSVPFKCALCAMRFNKLHKYIVHAKRHLGINNYHCDVCGKGYPFRAELEWHVREHTGEEPYLCEICGASFRARHGYDNHIRRHEKRFRYECHICKYGFNHLHALNAHVKAHLNIRDILCNVCGKGFTAKKHLLRHQQIHSDTKRYKCGVCGKAFAQDAGLRAHRKQHVEYTSLAEIAKKTEFRKGKYNYD